MKKKYIKPDFIKESLNIQSAVVRTCSDAGDYWLPVDMGEDDEGNSLIVFVPELDCTISDYDYMKQYGGDDGNCLYASTDDGKTFNS